MGDTLLFSGFAAFCNARHFHIFCVRSHSMLIALPRDEAFSATMPTHHYFMPHIEDIAHLRH